MLTFDDMNVDEPLCIFDKQVLDDREPVATAQQGLDVQFILDAIYTSAATGKEVRLTAK